MSPRFQLIFREDGKNDRAEYRYSDGDGAPHINGSLIVDGHSYIIRGVQWLLKLDGGDHKVLPRYICTLVVEEE